MLRITALLAFALIPVLVLAQPMPPPLTVEERGLDLLRLEGMESYAAWRERFGWRDLRPFSDSSARFQVLDGVLRLESRGESFLIGGDLPPRLRRSIAEYPYLRFTVRIGAVPRGARLIGEEADDAAFRIYAVFGLQPWQALAYVWSWSLPVGEWSARGRSVWGDFRRVRRKAFGKGEPFSELWLTVEVDLRRDFRAQFPRQALPVLRGLALKSDSNDTAGQRSLAWLREVSLHRTSLADAGYENWYPFRGGTLWFR